MPFIQNCAASDINIGQFYVELPDIGQFYKDPGLNSMLIQISDPAGWVPDPKHDFAEVHHFEFLDVEKDDLVYDPAFRCSQTQASNLVRLLQHALELDMNVIVHCTAGICRSGAVTEVGVMLGFEDTKRYRQPNLLVKHQMMRELGMTYDKDEQSVPINLSAKFDWEGDV